MRARTMTVAATMLVAMVVASGAALAESIAGGDGDNRLVGTNGEDNISGAGGNDDILGKGDFDRLFGDAGDDDVFGGKGGDALQSGLGTDDLFGQRGNDFVNAIDGQANDSVDCGQGANDLAGIDDLFQLGGGADNVSEDCETLYVAFLTCPCPGARSSGTVADLSGISSVKEAERAVEAGLLKKVER
jgi:hypothetical protein